MTKKYNETEQAWEVHFQVHHDKNREIEKIVYEGQEFVPLHKKQKKVKLSDETKNELVEELRQTLIGELVHDRVMREKTAERLVGNLRQLDSDDMVKRIADRVKKSLEKDIPEISSSGYINAFNILRDTLSDNPFPVINWCKTPGCLNATATGNDFFAKDYCPKCEKEILG